MKNSLVFSKCLCYYPHTMEKRKFDYITVLRNELQPVMGCTEPAAAALAELGLTNADLAKVEAAEKETYTDLTCDVLVIGTGAAGGAAERMI